MHLIQFALGMPGGDDLSSRPNLAAVGSATSSILTAYGAFDFRCVAETMPRLIQ